MLGAERRYLQEERRYQVGDGFTVPDFRGCTPPGGRVASRGPVTLRATYYDTEDRRLARAGVWLRHRRGEAAGRVWTAKLPTESPGARHEICRPGPATVLPADLVTLLTVYHRGALLEPAAVLRTVRTTYEIWDAEDHALAEIADDLVSVLAGRKVTRTFREIEVARLAGKRRLLDRLEVVLIEAGATRTGAGTSGAGAAARGAGAGSVGRQLVPRLAGAMGPAATAPPEPCPDRALPRHPTAADVVTETLRRDIGRLLAVDPFVRIDDRRPEDRPAVHQMRVACRRLRADLKTFRPLVQRGWAGELSAALGWLAGPLGAVRETEVLGTRLHRTSVADGLAPLDETTIARLDADLAARHEEALAVLHDTLRSPRYFELLERLIEAAGKPRIRKPAGAPARWVLPALMARPWRRLVDGPGSGDTLSLDAPDDAWHEVRIRCRRARYAAEAVAPVLGGAAAALASALGELTALLGEHQDATVAGQAWLASATADPDDHALAVTAGRLFERERAAVRRARAQFDQHWQAVTRKRVTAWLR